MPKAIDSIDKLVGQNIRIFRMAKGVTQVRLGEELGVTFQQIQKYENGTNRVGSGRLAKIAKVLNVPLTKFFHDRTSGGESEGGRDSVSELLLSPYALRILKALNKISDQQTVSHLVNFTESLAKRQ
jgi:transcriptional regulator with XRE-family HTH domain